MQETTSARTTVSTARYQELAARRAARVKKQREANRRLPFKERVVPRDVMRNKSAPRRKRVKKTFQYVLGVIDGWRERLRTIDEPRVQLRAALIIWFDKLSLLPFNLSRTDAYFEQVLRCPVEPLVRRADLMQALINLGYSPTAAADRVAPVMDHDRDFM